MNAAVVSSSGTRRSPTITPCWPRLFMKNICTSKSSTRRSMQAAVPAVPATDEFLITKEFASANEFSMFIEETAIKEGMDLIDVILNYCEDKDIDVDVTAKLVTKSLKEKLAIEFQQRKMLRSENGTLEDL